jgi:hypothetical protein
VFPLIAFELLRHPEQRTVDHGAIVTGQVDGGWIDWGHEASMLMVVPVVAWTLLQPR